MTRTVRVLNGRFVYVFARLCLYCAALLATVRRHASRHPRYTSLEKSAYMLSQLVPLSRNLTPPCLGRCPSPKVLICKLVLKISRTPWIARIRRLQQSQLTRRHVSVVLELAG
jgi:hypothetical protein